VNTTGYLQPWEVKTAADRQQESARLNPPSAPVALKPTADQSRRLLDFKTRLGAARDALASLSAGERKFSDRLPIMQAEVSALASGCAADADEVQIQKLLVAERRLALAREFCANTFQRREVIGREVQSLIGPLNTLLNEVQPQLKTRSFFGAGEAANQIALALTEIVSVMP
jgi:hypothetical protein